MQRPAVDWVGGRTGGLGEWVDELRQATIQPGKNSVAILAQAILAKSPVDA